MPSTPSIPEEAVAVPEPSTPIASSSSRTLRPGTTLALTAEPGAGQIMPRSESIESQPTPKPAEKKGETRLGDKPFSYG